MVYLPKVVYHWEVCPTCQWLYPQKYAILKNPLVFRESLPYFDKTRPFPFFPGPCLRLYQCGLKQEARFRGPAATAPRGARAYVAALPKHPAGCPAKIKLRELPQYFEVFVLWNSSLHPSLPGGESCLN